MSDSHNKCFFQKVWKYAWWKIIYYIQNEWWCIRDTHFYIVPPAFFVCVKNYYIFDSHNKRTSDNIWSVIIIHDLGGRKPSFSLHVHRPSKACTLNDQTFQSYLGNNLMRSKVNGNLSTTLCISLLDHRVFRIGIVFSLGTNHAKQIWSQSWLLSTDTIIIENSSDFSIQCVNMRPMWGKKK